MLVDVDKVLEGVYHEVLGIFDKMRASQGHDCLIKQFDQPNIFSTIVSNALQ